MTKEEIKSKIAVFERQLSGNLPDNIKSMIPAKLEKLKKQLAEMEEGESSSKSKEKTSKKEEKPKKKGRGRPSKKESEGKPGKPKKEKLVMKGKKTSPKTTVPDKPKKSSSKLTVKYGDKEYTEDDKDFCDVLKKSMKERREKMKKSNKKYKTVSISSKIGANIAAAVEKAVDNVDKNELKKKPKIFIAKFERVERAANEFLNSFKSILGEDYDNSDIKEDMESISALIEKIKSKYIKK